MEARRRLGTGLRASLTDELGDVNTGRFERETVEQFACCAQLRQLRFAVVAMPAGMPHDPPGRVVPFGAPSVAVGDQPDRVHTLHDTGPVVR